MGIEDQTIISAALAASEVARAHDLIVGEARVLGGYANIIIAFEAAPIVARIANASDLVRSHKRWMALEVEVAHFLKGAGIGATRPSTFLPPGPHDSGGFSMTFWDFVAVTPGAISPVIAGQCLGEIHRALATCRVDLPEMEPLGEAWRIIDAPANLAKLQSYQRELVVQRATYVRNHLASRTLELRPLHGDSHHGNLLGTGQGIFWTDFEYAHLGPREWDLACMTSSSYVLGAGLAAEAVLKGYAFAFDAKLLKLLIEARTLQAVAWALVIRGKPMENLRVVKQLEWLAARVSET